MKLIIHDLENERFQTLFPKLPEDSTIISNNGSISKCIGCFGCWIKSPGQCVIRDDYGDMGELLSKSEEVIIISECFYGGYSPFVKNILDRSISYIHPYFKDYKGEMHHRKRYNHSFTLYVMIYGKDLTQDEMATMKRLVEANCVNMHCLANPVLFFKSPDELSSGGYL